MKKYKVLTNLFRDFDQGDSLFKTMSLIKGEGYIYMGIINHTDTDTKFPSTLPSKLVENHPEYFEEIKHEKTLIEKIKDICMVSDEFDEWSICRTLGIIQINIKLK